MSPSTLPTHNPAPTALSAEVRQLLRQVEAVLVSCELHPYQLARVNQKVQALLGSLRGAKAQQGDGAVVHQTLAGLREDLHEIVHGLQTFQQAAHRHQERLLGTLEAARKEGQIDAAQADDLRRRALEARAQMDRVSRETTHRRLTAIDRILLESVERAQSLRTLGRDAIRG
jgi:hypothetical protein